MIEAADWLGHDCGPYCRDGKHAKVAWWVPDGVVDAIDLLRMTCEHLGVTFVYGEEAKEAGPVPAGVAGPWIEGDTGENGVVFCPPDAIPYLLVWAE